MNRLFLKHCFTAFCLVLVVSCHPEGCYGPKSFGYNTKGVTSAELSGTYVLDPAQATLLNSIGFTNHSGTFLLKPDMTFNISKIPCVMGFPIEGGIYSSASGKWRIAKQNAIWVLEIYDVNHQETVCRYASLSLPIIGESSPHGIELMINHDTGMWIKLKRSATTHEQSSLP